MYNSRRIYNFLPLKLTFYFCRLCFSSFTNFLFEYLRMKVFLFVHLSLYLWFINCPGFNNRLLCFSFAPLKPPWLNVETLCIPSLRNWNPFVVGFYFRSGIPFSEKEVVIQCFDRTRPKWIDSSVFCVMERGHYPIDPYKLLVFNNANRFL